VQLKVGEIQTEGSGKSKKVAEQDAARKGLEILKSDF
jgi:dsRNA-specific ribonuclease